MNASQSAGKGPLSAMRSVVVVPSRRSISPRGGDSADGGLEETEIAAHVTIPPDGGWGWVVVICAFLNLSILDGIVFTFGSVLDDMAKDLNQPEPMVALVNSITVAVYYIASPLVSALINRFGFRACTMSGAAISLGSYICSYFAKSIHTMYVFYGFLAGMGFSLINMSSNLVVSFYFERNRALAMAITQSGSGVGVLAFSPLNNHLIKTMEVGWRTNTLIQCGLLLIIFFLGMSFRPLVAVAVSQKVNDPTRTVTFLPSVTKHQASRSTTDATKPTTVSERVFGAVSNVNYPMSAAVIEESGAVITTSAGPSSLANSSLALVAYGGQGGVQKVTLDNVRSLTSRSLFKIEMTSDSSLDLSKKQKKRCCACLCCWEPHVRQSRPMYRDDAFYGGRVTKLPEYEKSVIGTTEEARTGLEYQLAVSRAAATSDLQERKGLCTTAVRRVLATMMDPALLRRCSFILLCMSAFGAFGGMLVPYVYVQERNSHMGIPSKHNSLFISVLGLVNSLGRLILGTLAKKVDPTLLTWVTQISAGVVTALSDLSFTVEYQYFYCGAFGFFLAGTTSLKPLIIVSMYGLDKLTNGMGLVFMFQGFGSLISTPLAGLIIVKSGYTAGFVVAGAFISLGGIVLIPAKYISKKENIKLRNT